MGNGRRASDCGKVEADADFTFNLSPVTFAKASARQKMPFGIRFLIPVTLEVGISFFDIFGALQLHGKKRKKKLQHFFVSCSRGFVAEGERVKVFAFSIKHGQIKCTYSEFAINKLNRKIIQLFDRFSHNSTSYMHKLCRHFHLRNSIECL